MSKTISLAEVREAKELLREVEECLLESGSLAEHYDCKEDLYKAIKILIDIITKY